MTNKFIVQLSSILSLCALIVLPTLALAKSDNANNPHGQPNATPSINISASASPDTSPSPVENLNRGHKDWKEKYNEYKTSASSQRITALKDLANTLIDNRLEFLANLKTEITSNSNISEETRQKLLNDLDKNAADLTTLKTQIANETDQKTLKDLVKSIYSKFQVYSVIGPSDLGQGLVSQGQYILGRLDAIERQLEKFLTQNKNIDKDITSIQTLIDQVKAKLADAKTQLQIADAKFKSMSPANTNDAKSLREAGKAAMKAAKQDLKDAHNLLKQIIQALKSLSPSPNSSVSPSITPSPTVSVSPSPSALATPTPIPTPTATEIETP